MCFTCSQLDDEIQPIQNQVDVTKSLNMQYHLFKFKGEEEACVDCFFPPDRSSLGPMSDKAFTEIAKNVIWQTPDQIFGKNNYVLFENSIHPTDVQQGELGTCYFLAAVSALAENFEMLRDLFHEEYITGKHFYTIDLFIEG